MVVAMLVVPVAAAAQTTAVHRTELVSISGGGVAANGVSTWSSISGDGRYVAFASSATNLVAGDVNGVRDVFVRDTQTGTTTLVSRATGGAIGNELSSMPSISADGRYVAFESWASNFGGGAVNKADIFVHDRKTGVTSLVSKASNGDAGGDGSHHPSISADGTRIAFYSYADNFSAFDDNSVPNTFVRDTETEGTSLVSRASGGGPGGDDESVNPAISADGEVVAFQSMADNLVAGSPDADNTVDVFAHRLGTGTTTYVSKASDGTPGSGDSSGESTNPAISADGRYVAFASRADTLSADDALFLSDIFVHDLNTAATTYVSRASDGTPGTGPPFGSFNPSISADGRYVVFDTTYTNLSDSDFDGLDVNENEVADIFVHDRSTGGTRYVSRSTAGVAGDKASYLPRISADGRYVAFDSHAETLSGEDAEDERDVFLNKLIPEPPANVAAPGLTGVGAVGATLTCDAGAWSNGTLTRIWRRDGIAIPGASAPTYTVTAADAGTTIDCLVTATNLDGSASLATPATVVPAAPGGGPDGTGASPSPGLDAPRTLPGPGAGTDTTAPRLSKVLVTPKRFRVGGGKGRGTTLRFTLGERGTVRVVVQRRKGKRWRTAGAISRPDVKSGRGALRITGRFGRRSLAPGRYRVAITATDAAGNRSATVRRAVRIVR
jgi:Tol biopolymer transport system component